MKQILLIGDSIRMGYCEYVKDLLKDRAEVIYPSENCRSSQNIIINLLNWSHLCDKEKVEIIHFNCGQWDAAHFNYDLTPLTSLSEYRKNLCAIVQQMKRIFPNAKLVFATTTPMNPAYPQTINPRTTEDIIAYNDAAKQVMEEHGIAINDLFLFAENWGPEHYIDYCHMTEISYKCLGKQVSDFIKSL